MKKPTPESRRERVRRFQSKRPHVTVMPIYVDNPDVRKRLVRLLVDLLLEAEAR